MVHVYRAYLVVAAVLSTMVGPAFAQIAVPDVSAGGKSSVPSLTTNQTPPIKTYRPNQSAPLTDGIAPTQPDLRCQALTAEQRLVTPGCR
jgi:hypothetical protein